MRVVITGGQGMLGRDLVRTAPPGVEAIPLARACCDVTRRVAVVRALSATRPDVVVNAAAFTAVDEAEERPEEAHAVNATGARIVAEATVRARARLVHISTNYVFNGTSSRPAMPSCPTAPINAYGRSKEAAERAVQDAAGASALVVRTGWLYTAERGFVASLLTRAMAGARIEVQPGQVGSPTWARDFARALWALIGAGALGIHHWTNAGSATRFEWALAACEAAAEQGFLHHMPDVTPGLGAGARSGGAARPASALLDCAATCRVLRAPARPWRAALTDCLSELGPSSTSVRRTTHPRSTP